MRLTRLFALVLAVLVLTTGVALAGPVRNAVQKVRENRAERRGCSSCQQPAALAFRPAASSAGAAAPVSCPGGRCPLVPAGFPTGR